MDGEPRVVRVVVVASGEAATAEPDVAVTGAVDGVGAIVVGEAEAVGAAVASLRRVGVRAAGFVGNAADPDCRAQVTSMAVELFAADRVLFDGVP